MKSKFIDGANAYSDLGSDVRNGQLEGENSGRSVFDANLYLGPCPFRALTEENNPGNILKSAEAQQGLFGSWSALFHKDWKSGFLRDAAHVGDFERGLLWHGITNASYPKWREDYVSLRSTHRFCSVKICPGLWDDGDSSDILLEAAAFSSSQNLPLILMRRLVDERLVPGWLKFHRLPHDVLLSFLARASETRIVLSNFTASEISDLLENGARAMAHVFFEVGTQTSLLGWYEQLVSSGLGARLIYGSSHPLHYAAGMAGILHARIPPFEKERILYDNAIGLFGL